MNFKTDNKGGTREKFLKENIFIGVKINLIMYKCRIAILGNITNGIYYHKIRAVVLFVRVIILS